MTDYTWPSTVYPATVALTWKDNTVIFASPLSGTTRTASRSGGKWRLSLTVDGLGNATQPNKPSTHLIEAFLFKLNGAEHRAIIPDFSYVRLGLGGGTPVAAATIFPGGKTIPSSGWPNSTAVLYAGDRVSIDHQMFVLTTDATSDGSGLATILVASTIRSTITSGTSIEIDAPTARYILTNKASFAARPGVVKTVLVEFEESIP